MNEKKTSLQDQKLSCELAAHGGGYSSGNQAHDEWADAEFAECRARFEAEQSLDRYDTGQHALNLQIAKSRLIRLYPRIFGGFELDFEALAASLALDRL